MNGEVIWTSGKRIAALFNSQQNNIRRWANYQVDTLCGVYIDLLWNLCSLALKRCRPKFCHYSQISCAQSPSHWTPFSCGATVTSIFLTGSHPLVPCSRLPLLPYSPFFLNPPSSLLPFFLTPLLPYSPFTSPIFISFLLEWELGAVIIIRVKMFYNYLMYFKNW